MSEKRSSGMAAVVFTDLVGSTEFMARIGEAAFNELRRDHFAALRAVTAQHRGREVKSLGDGILAVFESATDAVAGAIAMQQAVDLHAQRSKAPLAIRVGMALGEVSLEDEDVFGRPVVEAARLVAVASGGQILGTQAVRLIASAGPEPEVREVGALQLKGLPGTTLAFEFGWEPLETSPVPLPPLVTEVGPIFVGREPEREQLRDAWEETASGQPGVVLLAGEPGVGKTRLAAEVAIELYAEGATVLAGRCDEDLAVPYQLFVEPLRHVIDHTPTEALAGRLGRFGGELVRLVPELAERIPALPPPLKSDPESERYRVFDAVAAWMAEVCADRPVILVLDDIHWAAKPNLLLLRHVLRTPGLGRLLVVGTYRDTEVTHEHPLVEVLPDLRRLAPVRRILVDGLDEGNVTSYLAEVAGEPLDEKGVAVARAIHAETQGNPFFVREVVRHLTETGAFERLDGRWDAPASIEELAIPEGVRDVVGRRLSRLTEPCAHVLRVAAVVGMEFDLLVVQEAADADEEDVVRGLEEATAARLITELPGSALRYRFTHNLIRDTIYRGLSTARRVTLHRRVAEAFEAVHAGRLHTHLPALAHHYSRAGMSADAVAKAVHFARQAGDWAVAHLAHHDAVTFYGQALELLDASAGDDDVRSRLDLLIRLGDAQRRAGDPAHRGTLLDACRLARDCGDAESLARAALSNSRGMFAVIGAIDEDRVAMLEAALEAQGDADSDLSARLMANLAVEVVYADGGDRRHALSAEALAMARRLGDQATLGHALLARIVSVWQPATVGERLALTAELLSVATALEDAVLACAGCWHRFVAAMEAGDDAEADRCLGKAEKLAADLGQPTMRWLTMILRASRDLMSGLLGRSEEVATVGYELGRSAGHPDAFLYYGVHLFNVRFDRGDLDEIAGDVIRMATANPGVASLRATLALLYSETGQPEQARPVFEALVAQLRCVPQEASWPRAVAQAALTCVRLQDRDRAATLVDLLEPYAGQVICTGVSWVGAVAHYIGILTAVLGRLDDAEASLADAEAVHLRVGAPGWLARSRLERARVLLVRRAPGDVEAAQRLLALARTAAEQHGFALVAAAAEELAAEVSRAVVPEA